MSAMERPGTDGLIYGVLWVTFCNKGFVQLIDVESGKSVVELVVYAATD